VIYRAINKSIDNTQTRAVDKIAAVVNLTKTRIRKDFRKIKAFSKKLSGQLLAEGKPVGFMAFKPSALKKGGISIKLKRTGSREYFKHAFIEPGKGGALQVFERKKWGKAPYRPNYPYAKMPKIPHRFPLERKHAAALEDYYKDPRIYDPVQLYAAIRLQHHTLDQANFELSKI
jgi:hypothetical protein